MPPMNTTNPNPAPKPNRAHRGAPQITTGLRDPSQMDVRLGMATKDGRERDDSPVHTDTESLLPDLSKINPRHLEPLTPMEQRLSTGGPFTFRSRNRAHTVLLEAYPDRISAGGRIEKGYTVLAKFKEGVYTTNNVEHARLLMSNKSGYGMHLDYWDAEEEDSAAAVATYAAFRSAVKGNPQLYQRFMQDMAAGDFDEVDPDPGGDFDRGGQPIPQNLQSEIQSPKIPALEGGPEGDLLRNDA